MTTDLVLVLINVVCGLILTGIGIEMVNNPPAAPWKKWAYRAIFAVCGIAIIIATAGQSITATNEQNRARIEAANTERELSDRLSKSDGKLDAINHFEQQFLDFVSKNRDGSSAGEMKAYEAMSAAVLRLAQRPNSPTGNLEAKREIKKMLTKFSEKGSDIREKWIAAKGTPEDIQRPYAKQVHQWHADIGSYLSTIPRGDAYLARLKGAVKTGSGGYTIGINPNLYDDWDLLASDLAILNDFMKDPELGEP